MGLARYQIVSQGDEWGVLHDGDVRNRYATKEAAFEAAVAAASLDTRPRRRKAAGLFCVAVPNGVTAAMALDEADVVVPSLAELPLESLLARFA